MALISLNHYLDHEWVRYAYECTRKDGAVGVDGQTAEVYAANLQQNLLSLIDRLKAGHYQAPPVRRHYIPKADGGKRGRMAPTGPIAFSFCNSPIRACAPSGSWATKLASSAANCFSTSASRSHSRSSRCRNVTGNS